MGFSITYSDYGHMPYSPTAARIENEETGMEMGREGMKGKRNGEDRSEEMGQKNRRQGK